MNRILCLLLLTLAVGCNRPKTTAKYFSGEPVEHWLKQINDRDPKARKKAADVLGNVGPVDPGAIPALINALKDKDASVRDAAVLGLSKIGPPAASAASALEEATRDQDETVRKHAAAALQRVQGS
jgi:HEAT repeat protein